MPEITAQMVKDLRDRTGAPIHQADTGRESGDRSLSPTLHLTHRLGGKIARPQPGTRRDERLKGRSNRSSLRMRS